MAFFDVGNLARHCRQAHAERTATENHLTKEKFLCRRRGCNQALFSSRELYIEHLQQHSGDTRIYSCESCSCVFSSSGNLSKHRKTFHGTENATVKTEPSEVLMDASAEPPEVDRKYNCSQCERTFQNHFQLNRHMRYAIS